MKHVVIAGGGFSGIVAARHLAKNKKLKVTLITDDENFRYCPALYRVATGYLRRQATISIHDLLPQRDNLEIVIASVYRIDRQKRIIKTVGGKSYKYDYAVLCLGVVTSYFGIAGLEKYSYGIKSIEAINQLHNHLHEQMLQTHHLDKNYVIVGAGPTGVELSAGLINYLRFIAKNHGIKKHHIKLELIEAADRVLPTFDKRASPKTLKRLRRLGITVLVSKKVEGETVKSLNVDGRSIPTHTVIWTAGTINHPFYKDNEKQFQLSPRGRVIVDEYMRVDDHLYVIGDNAETKFSGLAETAVRQSKYISHDISYRIAGIKPKVYEDVQPAYVVPVGSNWAVMQWRQFVLCGFLVAGIRKMADLIGYADVMGWSAAFKIWMQSDKMQESCPRCNAKLHN